METITLEQALTLFVDVIVRDLTHQDYHHVCQKSKLYKQLITGHDIDELLQRFNPREDEVMFEQRKRITQVITPAVASSLMKPFYKVPRTDRVVKKVSSIDDSENAGPADEVMAKMDTFYGADNDQNGLDYYLQNRFVELTFSDPNAFIVTEFDAFDPMLEKATPYPFEVTCWMARMFRYVNNQLIWLVAREDLTYMEPMTEDMLSYFGYTDISLAPTHVTMHGYKWTMYTDQYSIVFEQVGSDHHVPGQDDEGYNPDVYLNKLDTGNYMVTENTHGAGKVPAKRVGYKRDLLTDGRTFVNPFDDALCYFIDSIKTVSEFSLTKSQHTFPQKFQYVPACVGESEMNSCFNGRAAMGGICKICRGSGTMPIHTSAQDVVTLKIPEDTSKMMDLNKVMAYFSPPIELIKFQNELVKQVNIDCHQTVFNSTVLLKDNSGKAAIAETATAKNLDMDSINDTLAPFAEVFSSFWLFEGDIIARFTDNNDLVEFVHRFPTDFKMKSISDLYNEMQIANNSFAPTFLIELINDDIAATKFQDDPDQLLMYQVKKRLDPFRGATESVVASILTLDYTPLWKKVLSTNFEDIISDASANNDNFYLLDYEEQKKIVRDIVEEIILEIDSTKAPAPTLKPIVPVDPNAPVDPATDTALPAPAAPAAKPGDRVEE